MEKKQAFQDAAAIVKWKMKNSTTHELKIMPEFYNAVIENKKKFEIRKNDRNFQVGDNVVLREFSESAGYSGRYALGTILYITDYNQKEEYIVFSFQLHCFSYGAIPIKEEK